MADDIYNFDKDFDPVEFRNVMRRFRDECREEAMKKHPAGKSAAESASKTSPDQKQLRNEASAYIGLAIVWFLFVTIPLALLFAGIAVVPATEAIFNTEIGYWTAFFLLLTLRWLIPRPRNNAFTGKDR